MSRSILIDCRMMMEKPDGIGRYLSQLVPELINLAPDIHFHILRRPNPWSEYNLEELQRQNVTQHISKTKQMSLRQHFAVPWLARRLGVDLLHYPHYDAPVSLASVPVVATIHDLKYLKHPHWYRRGSRLKNIYARWSYGQTAKHASAIIAVSHFTADQFRNTFPRANAQVTVIHEAVGREFRSHPEILSRVAQERHGIARPFVLTVGERRPHKNQAGLIRAFAHCNARNTHDLVIVGGAYGDYLEPERVVSEFGMENNVHFLDKVSDADLRALYSEADVFALVSKYEGFGFPLLEAMNSGTAVVASETTATGEIAGSGALLVDPDDHLAIGDAIYRLLTDEGQRTIQIEKGRKRAQQFCWNKAAMETLAVYRRLLGE